MLREFANNAGVWTVQRDYVYRDGVPLAAALSTGHLHHLHPDHLGTPRLITRNVGFGPQQVAFHAYYPYGVEATQFNLDDERMKFTSHERDLGVSWSPADDLDYMHARWYNPQVGRFLSTDRLPLISRAMAQPQLWNRYAYARANPLAFIDPSGNYIAIPGADTRQEGEDELALLKDALAEIGQHEAADLLKLETVEGEVRVTSSGVDLSKFENPTIALIGKAINDGTRIELSVTSRTSSDLENNGGAITRWEARTRSAAIVINPLLVASSAVSGRSSDGRLVGLSVSLGTAMAHELGHAVAAIRKGGIWGTNTDASALRYENQHRLLLARPSTIPSATRIRH